MRTRFSMGWLTLGLIAAIFGGAAGVGADSTCPTAPTSVKVCLQNAQGMPETICNCDTSLMQIMPNPITGSRFPDANGACPKGCLKETITTIATACQAAGNILQSAPPTACRQSLDEGVDVGYAQDSSCCTASATRTCTPLLQPSSAQSAAGLWSRIHP